MTIILKIFALASLESSLHWSKANHHHSSSIQHKWHEDPFTNELELDSRFRRRQYLAMGNPPKVTGLTKMPSLLALLAIRTMVCFGVVRAQSSVPSFGTQCHTVRLVSQIFLFFLFFFSSFFFCSLHLVAGASHTSTP